MAPETNRRMWTIRIVLLIAVAIAVVGVIVTVSRTVTNAPSPAVTEH